MIEPPDGMPPQPKTVEIEAVKVPTPLTDLDRIISAIEAKMNEKLDAFRGDVCVHLHDINSDMKVLRGEAQAMALWRGEVESWRSRTSDRVHDVNKTSSHSLEEAAKVALALAAEATERKRTDTETDERIARIERKTDAQTAMLEKAAAWAKDPKVLAFAFVVWNIVQKWAERHGYL